MKKLIVTLLCAFASFVCLAETESEKADRDTAQTSYEYCLGMQDVDSLNLTELLACINEEMEFMGYAKFASVDEVKRLISLEDNT